jgi:peroxiredoxin
VELRQAFAELRAMDDVRIVYVMPDNQMTPKTRQFIRAHALDERVIFALDPGSRAIDRLGLRRPDPDAMEAGVPHPATYVLDRDGVVRFADVRENFHFWLAPELPLQALAGIP